MIATTIFYFIYKLYCAEDYANQLFIYRWTYLEFFSRYRVLCRSKEIKRNDMRSTCEKIIANMIRDEDKFKFGRTKIFFRAGQVAYMEKLRADRLKACIVMMQKTVRGYLQKKRYQKILTATLLLQRFTRGYRARRLVHHMRRTAAAVRLQSCIRGWIQRTKYLTITRAVVRIQARVRGRMARERYVSAMQYRASVRIQKHVRGYLERQRYMRIMRGICAVQGRVRCFLARKKLKKLKIEAKSVEHQRKLNKGLENKIISMQQKISEMKVEKENIKKVADEAAKLKLQLAEMKRLETDLKGAKQQIAELEKQLKVLEEKLELERGEKMDVLNEKEKAEKENKRLVEELNEKNKKLSEELAKKTEEMLKKEDDGAELLKQKLDVEKERMLLEHDQEKSAYQRLLKELNALEMKNDFLEEELSRYKGSSSAHKVLYYPTLFSHCLYKCWNVFHFRNKTIKIYRVCFLTVDLMILSSPSVVPYEIFGLSFALIFFPIICFNFLPIIFFLHFSARPAVWVAIAMPQLTSSWTIPISTPSWPKMWVTFPVKIT